MNDPSGGKSPTSVVPLLVTSRFVLYPQSLQTVQLHRTKHGALLRACATADQILAIGIDESDFVRGEPEHWGPIHPIATLARITQKVSLSGGRELLVLQGMQRARVLAEDVTENSLRKVTVQPLDSIHPKVPAIDRYHRCQELLASALMLLKPNWQQRLLEEVSIRTAELGDLCDLLSQSLPLSTACRRRLLDELDVDQRSDILHHSLRQLCLARQASPHVFPPHFGVN